MPQKKSRFYYNLHKKGEIYIIWLVLFLLCKMKSSPPTICHVSDNEINLSKSLQPLVPVRPCIQSFLLARKIKKKKTTILQLFLTARSSFQLVDYKATIMSTVPRNNPSLCSSPPLPRSRTSLTNKHNSLVSFSSNNTLVKNHGISTKKAHFARACVWRVKALDEKQTAESSDSKEEGKEVYEEYEVEIVQPYGLKFVKGRDGGTYIDAIAPGGFADQTKMFTVGDKVIATRFVYSPIYMLMLYVCVCLCVCLQGWP